VDIQSLTIIIRLRLSIILDTFNHWIADTPIAVNHLDLLDMAAEEIIQEMDLYYSSIFNIPLASQVLAQNYDPIPHTLIQQPENQQQNKNCTG